MNASDSLSQRPSHGDCHFKDERVHRVKIILSIFTILILAQAAQWFFFHEAFPWVLLSAILLALIDSDNPFVLMGAAVGLLLIMLIVMLLKTDSMVVLGFIAVLSGVTALIGQRQPTLAVAAFIMPVMAMLTSVSVPKTGQAVCALMVGMAMVLLARLIAWPHFVKYALREALVKLMAELSNLNNDIFACYLMPDYQENHYTFERRIHACNNRCMALLERLNSLQAIAAKRLPQEKLTHLHTLINQCRILYDNVMACAALRWRASDHYAFGLIRDELTRVCYALQQLFAEMGVIFNHKNPLLNTEGLQQAIEALEQNYESVIKVADKDPLVYQLFIANLCSLSREIQAYFAAARHHEVGFIYD